MRPFSPPLNTDLDLHEGLIVLVEVVGISCFGHGASSLAVTRLMRYRLSLWALPGFVTCDSRCVEDDQDQPAVARRMLFSQVRVCSVVGRYRQIRPPELARRISKMERALSDRQVSHGQPSGAERGNGTAFKVLGELRQICSEQREMMVGPQLGNVAQVDN